LARLRGIRSGRIAGSNRRLTDWNEGPFTTAVQSISAAGTQIALTNSQATVEGLTIVRIRGEFVAWLETVTTIGDGFANAAFGMCIVNENAAGIGVTAIPSPLDDVTWDGWLVHRFFGPVIGFSTTESENTGVVSQVRMEVDSKAMRKFKATDVLVFVIGVAQEVGTATLTWGTRHRLLLKLP